MNDSITAVLADLARQRGEIDRIVAGLRQLYGIPEPEDPAIWVKHIASGKDLREVYLGHEGVGPAAIQPPPKPPRSTAPARASKANEAPSSPKVAPPPEPPHAAAKQKLHQDNGSKPAHKYAGTDRLAKIRAYLARQPERAAAAHKIAEGIGEDGKRVGVSLAQYASAGQLRRVKYGVYALLDTAAPAGKSQPKPAVEPKPPAEPNGTGFVLTKAHPSHKMYRDGSLLKCAACKLVHGREEVFARVCEG